MSQENDLQAVQELNEAYRLITEQLGRVIVGQQQVIEELLVAMFARGHCLLVGVPGLAKTLMIRTLADALSLDFSRIQFTPDLMPADITGTEVIQEDKQSGMREFKFLKGPIFANVILADEINRTPPEDAVRPAGGDAGIPDHRRRHAAPAGRSRSSCWPRRTPSSTKGPIRCPRPSWTASCSTSSSIIPSEDEELEIVKRTTADISVPVTPTLERRADPGLAEDRPPRAGGRPRDPLRLAACAAARGRGKADVPDFITRLRAMGRRSAGQPVPDPGRKARAVLQGRFYAGCDDVRAVACPVLRHRILTNFNAEAEGIKTDEIVRRLIDTIAVDDDATADGDARSVQGTDRGLK